jgi:ABC-type branched-subunit amino acid transport system permease subunit
MVPVERRSQIAALLAGLVLLLIIPFAADRYWIYVVALVAYQVMVSIGLSLLMGYTGQGSVAHPAFVAIGAYVSTLAIADLDAPFWLAAPFAALVAGLVGYLLGFPALRLSGHYLLLVTLGFLQLVHVVLVNWTPVTGGSGGLKARPVSVGGLSFATTESYYWLIVPATLVVAVLAFMLINSRIGRAWTAIRDSSIAAAAIGIDVRLYKTMAFGVSATIAGLAGAFYAPLVGFLDPSEFSLWTAVTQITFLVVGGMYSLWGAILGSVLLSALPEVMRPIHEYRDLAFGILLLVMLMAAPTGVIGRIQELLRQGQPDPTAAVAPGGAAEVSRDPVSVPSATSKT